ncbi:unnamed protein product [Ambrosiozyma monospora]|uniref:Unnamed protein product n=1 Tax=Ambrosiozyma monospora TaxID=43982 RepID=A0A9W6YMS3_AMBMO|nr:unnamed protein product [Ambrosiozyma monospora]
MPAMNPRIPFNGDNICAKINDSRFVHVVKKTPFEVSLMILQEVLSQSFSLSELILSCHQDAELDGVLSQLFSGSTLVVEFSSYVGGFAFGLKNIQGFVTSRGDDSHMLFEFMESRNLRFDSTILMSSKNLNYDENCQEEENIVLLRQIIDQSSSIEINGTAFLRYLGSICMDLLPRVTSLTIAGDTDIDWNLISELKELQALKVVRCTLKHIFYVDLFNVLPTQNLKSIYLHCYAPISNTDAPEMVEELNTFSQNHNWVQVKINSLLLTVENGANRTPSINWFDTLKPIGHLITDIDTVMTDDIKSDFFSHYHETKRAQFHYLGPNKDSAHSLQHSPMSWASSSLKQLFFTCWNGECDFKFDFSQLPNLIKLVIHSTKINKKTFSSLPKSLKVLQLSNCTIEQKVTLPLNIEEFKTERLDTNINIAKNGKSALKKFGIRQMFPFDLSSKLYIDTLVYLISNAVNLAINGRVCISWKKQQAGLYSQDDFTSNWVTIHIGYYDFSMELQPFQRGNIQLQLQLISLCISLSNRMIYTSTRVQVVEWFNDILKEFQPKNVQLWINGGSETGNLNQIVPDSFQRSISFSEFYLDGISSFHLVLSGFKEMLLILKIDDDAIPPSLTNFSFDNHCRGLKLSYSKARVTTNLKRCMFISNLNAENAKQPGLP